MSMLAGYGANAGEPTAEDVYADSETAYDKLLEMGFEPEHIILYGQSGKLNKKSAKD